jgi:serine/threonine-protein kinase ATR
MNQSSTSINRIVPFAVEASWATCRWETLQKYLLLYNAGDITEVFNLGIAQALLCLRMSQLDNFAGYIEMLRDKVGSSMTYSATSSLQACHDALLKAHVLSELEIIAGTPKGKNDHHKETLDMLNRRLEVIGAYVNDKQYVLGIRRAAMMLME